MTHTRHTHATHTPHMLTKFAKRIRKERRLEYYIWMEYKPTYGASKYYYTPGIHRIDYSHVVVPQEFIDMVRAWDAGNLDATMPDNIIPQKPDVSKMTHQEFLEYAFG